MEHDNADRASNESAQNTSWTTWRHVAGPVDEDEVKLLDMGVVCRQILFIMLLPKLGPGL